VKILTSIFLFFLLPYFSPAQEKKDTIRHRRHFDLLAKSVKFPHHYKTWGFQTAAGLSIVIPPYDVLENYYEAPLVNLEATFGMPAGFSLHGEINTIVVSNQFRLGAKWNFIHRNFGFNVGYDLAYIYGWAKVGGFDNTGSGIIHYPNLSVGYKTKPVALTLKGELVILGYRRINSGSMEIGKTYTQFDGGTFALYIEQRLWRNKLFIIGLKDNYVKDYWAIWLLFSTFDRYYHIPELYFSWTL
jgi:hypothetical protein